MQMLLNIASASPPWPEDLGDFRNMRSGGRSLENANSSKQRAHGKWRVLSVWFFFPTDPAFTREPPKSPTPTPNWQHRLTRYLGVPVKKRTVVSQAGRSSTAVQSRYGEIPDSGGKAVGSQSLQSLISTWVWGITLHYYTTDSIRSHGSSCSQDGGVILQVFSQSGLPAGTASRQDSACSERKC